MASDTPGFFAELKRRHVWRVAAAYAVAAWLVVQIATQVFPFFDIPSWVVRLVVILLAIGFPVAVVWAWIYELTPEGIRRTPPAGSPAARPEHETRSVGRRLNAVIITVLVLAVILLLGNQFVWHKGVREGAVAPASAPAPGAPLVAAASAPAKATPQPVFAAAVPEKSVAVLPFANEGGKADEQFFSDGLSEDLITALSQFAGLKVISRNSAFQFRDSKDTSAKIGQSLGAAHLLEGSVQRAGEEVRITATLVNAADGTVVWSQRYDKPYKDLFALQDAITSSVADALKAKLMTAPGAVVQSDRPPGGSLAAYTAYQHGVSYSSLGTEAGQRLALTAFNAAIRGDPKYAAAYARLSGAWLALANQFLSDPAKIAEAKAAAREASATALKLDPDSAQAHASRAYLLRTMDFELAGADAEYRRALQLAPHDAAVQFGLGNIRAVLGQNARAAELTRQALASDPLHASWYNWLSLYFGAVGKLDEAKQAIDTAITLQPGAVAYHQVLAIIEILQGDANAALAAAQAEPAGPWHEIALALALQASPDRATADAALAKLMKNQATVASYQIAQLYALRHDPDNAFKWLDRAWAARDPGIGYLLMDPLVLRYRDDPRFAAFCRKVGLPTSTDAVAMK